MAEASAASASKMLAASNTEGNNSDILNEIRNMIQGLQQSIQKVGDDVTTIKVSLESLKTDAAKLGPRTREAEARIAQLEENAVWSKESHSSRLTSNIRKTTADETTFALTCARGNGEREESGRLCEGCIAVFVCGHLGRSKQHDHREGALGTDNSFPAGLAQH